MKNTFAYPPDCRENLNHCLARLLAPFSFLRAAPISPRLPPYKEKENDVTKQSQSRTSKCKTPSQRGMDIEPNQPTKPAQFANRVRTLVDEQKPEERCTAPKKAKHQTENGVDSALNDMKQRVVDSQRQPGPVASPSIQGQKLPATLVLLAQVLGHATADLSEGAAHHSAEVALQVVSTISSQ
jgi:hypothetical protein